MSMQRDNFRANQPPSKVLHIRNLPPDATEQDIVDLCKPFGRIIKTKLNAAQAKTGVQSNQGNQAFVEFENVNCAINMIYSFVGSVDPPKVRNKTVYLQYSTRQEIGSGNWGGGGGADQPTGNVVLIIMDNIQVALGPNLDTVHMLCAAFGEVAKIAMFEKASGLQALVQFKDGRHAKEAQQTLDGTSIPEHLVPSHPGKVTMKVSFSAHPDLSIRSQSERSRDFSLPYHPDGSGQAAAAGMGAAAGDPHGAAGSSSNVLLCMIDDVAYTPSVEALHQVFSTYGYVQKITVFEKSGHWQALVQYPDDGAAGVAKQSLDGYSMYPGGKNKLKLSYSTHRDLSVWVNNERNWDFTVAPGGPAAAAAAAAAAASSAASRSAAASSAASRSAAAGDGGGGSGSGAAAGPNTAAEAQAEAAAGGSRPGSAAAGPSGRQQQDLNAPITGMDYEHAHNEAARIAIEALGDSMASLPSHSGGPRTMLPHPRASRPHYGGGGPGGYGPGPGAPPPPGFGYPPGGYGYPPYGGYPPEYPPYGY